MRLAPALNGYHLRFRASPLVFASRVSEVAPPAKLVDRSHTAITIYRHMPFKRNAALTEYKFLQGTVGIRIEAA